MARPPKKVTIRDVARLAGTSTSTVSIAISGQGRISETTRRHVIDAADRLGWRPDRRASGLRQFNPRVVGIVYDAEQPFQARLLDCAYVAMRKQGIEVIVAAATPHHDEQACVAELRRNGCQALVTTGADLTDSEIAQVARRMPTMSLGREVHIGGVDTVACDSHRGSEMAVEFLVGLGHGDIVHVDGGGVPMTDMRTSGYAAAMARHGLAGRVRVIHGGVTLDAGIGAARALLAGESLPTGVTCFNDLCAAGLVRELRLLGVRVPEQVSVVGFDDAPTAADPTTALTTVGQDMDALADRAAKQLSLRIADGVPMRPGAEKVDIIEPSIVIRTTTAAPRSFALSPVRVPPTTG
ncbi:putative HTH-type transcriptional repressor ExuR [Acidipropionibacterium virtanenii]|uniref:Putative HTH-type transcriptional repressor ExuR n=2 Tax=Acidipropionibacterium virtanenii TaxID=2057246 RepID=A0A344UW83_9ACTN|nr:putative HTH-type transcriptional repressor ExuR [Acidipropionibacterium virtanenii]